MQDPGHGRRVDAELAREILQRHRAAAGLFFHSIPCLSSKVVITKSAADCAGPPGRPLTCRTSHSIVNPMLPNRLGSGIPKPFGTVTARRTPLTYVTQLPRQLTQSIGYAPQMRTNGVDMTVTDSHVVLLATGGTISSRASEAGGAPWRPTRGSRCSPSVRRGPSGPRGRRFPERFVPADSRRHDRHLRQDPGSTGPAGSGRRGHPRYGHDGGNGLSRRPHPR